MKHITITDVGRVIGRCSHGSSSVFWKHKNNWTFTTIDKPLYDQTNANCKKPVSDTVRFEILQYFLRHSASEIFDKIGIWFFSFPCTFSVQLISMKKVKIYSSIFRILRKSNQIFNMFNSWLILVAFMHFSERGINQSKQRTRAKLVLNKSFAAIKSFPFSISILLRDGPLVLIT